MRTKPVGTKYLYDAIVVDVYDGDTIRLDTDLGKKIWELNEPHRLNRINAPEVRGPQREHGLISTEWLRETLPVGTRIEIETIKGRTFVDKKGKFGRWLAEIWLGDLNINDELVRQGLAVYQGY